MEPTTQTNELPDESQLRAEVDEFLKIPFSQRHMSTSNLSDGSTEIMDRYSWLRRVSAYQYISIIVLMLSLVIMSVVIAVLASRPPITLGYAVDQDGRFVMLDPVDVPHITDVDAMDWAVKKMHSIHKLSIHDYENHINNLAVDFTREAFDNYVNQLRRSQTLAKIEDNGQSTWIEPTSAPRIINKGIYDGAYEWVISMESNLIFGGGNFTTVPVPIKSEIVIRRSRDVSNLSGLIIASYIAEER